MYVSPIFLQWRILQFLKTVFEWSALGALFWWVTVMTNVFTAIVFVFLYVAVCILYEMATQARMIQGYDMEERIEDYEVDVEDYPDEDV